MRKNLILSAVAFAAWAFAGCSQDDTLNESPTVNKAIEFGTYVGRDAEARATKVELAEVKASGFGVFAYYTHNVDFANATTATPNFMNNQKVTYDTDANTWTYAPVKYWPNNPDDKVSFFAYAPYSEDAAPAPSFSNGQLSLTFQVAKSAGLQSDLLWSKNTASNTNIDKTKGTTTSQIKFEFAHALSRIGFTVQGAVDQKDPGGTLDSHTTITVNEVILSNGSYAYPNDGSTPVAPTAGEFHKQGDLNLNDFTWSNESGTQLFTLKSDDFAIPEGTNPHAFTLTGDQSTAKDLTNSESYLMVIPQKLNNLYVNIEYTVTTTDGTHPTNSSTITNYISKQVTNSTTGDNSFTFEMGKAYTFNLILGMTSVKIDASVVAWDEQTSTNVDLPENTETPTTGA